MGSRRHRVETLVRLAADYTHLYGGRSEDGTTQAARAMQRFATNPSLHAVTLMRGAVTGPAGTRWLLRRLLMRRHSIHIDPTVELGPGLILPHPFGIVLGRGVRIGSDVTLYHNITVGILGAEDGAPTVVGDGAIVHTNSFLARGVKLGAGAVIGANSYVAEDIPGGVVFSRGRVSGRVGNIEPGRETSIPSHVSDPE